ncbi:hypothetical protein [Streptomyces sp. NPDC002402]
MVGLASRGPQPLTASDLAETCAAGINEALAELTGFKTLAVSRLTAQHGEIERLREQAAGPSPARRRQRNGLLRLAQLRQP